MNKRFSKTMRITLIDGITIDKPIEFHDANLMIEMLKKPANDQWYYQACVAIAVNGLVDDSTNATQLKLIAPSQIKSVEVIFTEVQEKQGSVLTLVQ